MSTPSARAELLRRASAEAIGTMLLVVGVVGSGIMAQRLSADGALVLLCNSLATGAVLAVLILIFAPVSGAHFNPAVTLALVVRGEISASHAATYGAAQVVGGVFGTILSHAMFGLSLVAAGTSVRTGAGQWLGEGVATFGLLLTIFGSRARGSCVVASAAGVYIMAAYWFTSSTSFANPAVTIARTFTPTFAGIRPGDAPMFLIAQLAVVPFAAIAAQWLFEEPD